MTLLFRKRRIRIQCGPSLTSQRNLALAAASLLAPCALIAFTLTCWSVAADRRWTSGFFVARGVFSHWQSWLVASSLLFLIYRVLAQGTDEAD